MKVRDLIEKLRELPEDAVVMDYSDAEGEEVRQVKYDSATQSVWMTGQIPLSTTEMQLSPEKHLAAILSAWGETDGYLIFPGLHDALRTAEMDFDGVESEVT